MSSSSSALPGSALKPKVRLPLLDGLRGIAAIVVVIFHISEYHFTDPLTRPMNHAYLAVDFFFLLSGYVIGYAYDDRWNAMSTWTFMKRRVLRLHPLVILSALLGAVLFFLSVPSAINPFYQDGASALFEKSEGVTVGTIALMTLLGALMIPVRPSMDVRGWGEIFPLNGPAWSLFFEYLANFLYGIGFRRCGIKTLSVLTVIFAGALIYAGCNTGDGTLIGGWTWQPGHLQTGLSRVLFPFFGGLLLFRLGAKLKVKGAFFWSTLLLLLVLVVIPRIGGKVEATYWQNGLAEALMVILIFPVIVMLGAGTEKVSSGCEKACEFLGEMSYPLYLVHYPIFYVYFGYAAQNKLTLETSWPYAILAIVASFVTAYLGWRFVDKPIRKRLAKFAR